MGVTHRWFGAGFWLAGTVALDAAAGVAGADPVVHPVVAVVAAPLAASFADGRNSPDVDQLWAKGPPRRGYHWRGHRGWTHRPWFAVVLTAVTALLAWRLAGQGVDPDALPVVFAPVAGWWSHLLGDMIYGRILVFGEPVGLGWETGGLSERGRTSRRRGRSGRQLLPFAPATALFAALAVLLAGANLALAAA